MQNPNINETLRQELPFLTVVLIASFVTEESVGKVNTSPIYLHQPYLPSSHSIFARIYTSPRINSSNFISGTDHLHHWQSTDKTHTQPDTNRTATPSLPFTNCPCHNITVATTQPHSSRLAWPEASKSGASASWKISHPGTVSHPICANSLPRSRMSAPAARLHFLKIHCTRRSE